ncbi:DMT family transporter [Thalassolituus sp. LLYu03]|uniref:DMT family transporter n=1 Tax=Thalassolituus sp. LLYu03 TaxID=3421656 RepID=UPI003D2D79F3
MTDTDRSQPLAHTTVTTRYGLTLALSAAFLFSTKPILIKWLYELGMSSLPLMWLRMMMAMPVYLVVGWIAWRKLADKPALPQMLQAAGIGLLGYWLASFLDLKGLEYVSAQLERLTLYAYPTLVVLLGAAFFGQPFGKQQSIALLLTYGGLLLVFGHDFTLSREQGDVTTGTLLILASALSFALYILFSKKAIAQMGSLLFTSVAMGAAGLATAVHYGLAEGIELPPMNSARWSGTIALTLFATVLPSFMVSEAIRRIGPAKAAVSGTIGPVMTTVMAVVLLGEPFGWLTAIGMALVMLGVRRLQK